MMNHDVSSSFPAFQKTSNAAKLSRTWPPSPNQLHMDGCQLDGAPRYGTDHGTVTFVCCGDASVGRIGAAFAFQSVLDAARAQVWHGFSNSHPCVAKASRALQNHAPHHFKQQRQIKLAKTPTLPSCR